MYRLHVLMRNGNEPYFDFFTLVELSDYRDSRRMEQNKAIARLRIEPITFEQWRADRDLF
jgi:hypothetical protein